MKSLDGFKTELNSIEGVAHKKAIRKKVFSVLEPDYAEVEPPILDYFSNYEILNSKYIDETARAFKFMDADGQLLVLSPDLNLAIENIAMFEYLKDESKPMRLCYSGKAYTLRKENGRDRVYDQIGAELIGVGGVEADAEVISKAVDCVRACGLSLTNFTVELCHVGYLRELLDSFGLTEDEYEVISDSVKKKNTFSFKKDKKNAGLFEKVSYLLDAVPHLYGAPEAVLNTARKLASDCGCAKAAEAAEYTSELCDYLVKKGYGIGLTLDLTLNAAGNVYSGIMFHGMTSEMGTPLFSGGRYDGVLGRNIPSCKGKTIPATGFSLSVDNLMKLSQYSSETAPKEFDHHLKVAVGKGRIESKFFDILSGAGVTLKESSNRALKLYDKQDNYQFSPIKPSDVPIYVESGTFDVGIVGIDSVWEADKDVYELLDLGFSTCKLCVAGKDDADAKKAYFDDVPMPLATKYVGIAKKTFANRNVTDILQLTGSVEVAPLMDLAPIIFDIVETGGTLRENNLVVYEELYECSAVVIANKMSLKTRKREISEFLSMLIK